MGVNMALLGEVAERSSKSSYYSFPIMPGQNPWLDVLRSAAVILVLLRHGVRATPEADYGYLSPLQNLFSNGWVGVDLFLVLSGYLISGSIIRASRHGHFADMKYYFSARILRIVPAYFAVLALVVIGAFPFYVPPAPIDGTVVFYHLLFLQDYLPSTINVVFWSLGVEEKFYIIAPLLLFILALFSRPALALLFLAGIFLLSPVAKLFALSGLGGSVPYEVFFPELRSPFHMTLEPLIIGVSISLIERREVLNVTSRRAQSLFAVSASILLVWLCTGEFLAAINWLDVTVQPVMLAALFGVLVYSSVCMKNVPVTGMSFFRPVARLSYSLYLVHFPLIPLSKVVAERTPAPDLFFWVYYVSLSLLAALLLHFCVEKPFLGLKGRLLTKPAAVT